MEFTVGHTFQISLVAFFVMYPLYFLYKTVVNFFYNSKIIDIFILRTSAYKA